MAIDYTWSSATTGGLWSGTANWTPNSLSGGPTTADTVLLDTTASGTTRIVTIDSTAWGAATSGTITSLTLTQTNSGTNTLDVGKNFRVTNAVVLGGSNGGVARVIITPQSTSNVTATFSGGLTLNTGGVLSLNFLNPASGTSRYIGDVTGNVTVQGGLLQVEAYQRNGTATGSQQNTITGSLTMTSGTVFINSIPGGSSPGSDTDRRLRVTGNLSITGGIVQTATTNGGLYLDGATNTFQPTSIVNSPSLSLQANGAQSLLTNQTNTITARGTGVKTVSSSIIGTNLGTVVIVDGGTATASSATTFRLGSNLTLQAGSNLPSTSNLSVREASGRTDVAIDADAYTLDLTATTAVFAPNSPFVFGTGTVTYWAFTGTAGRIVANGFNFTSGANSVATSVGPGLILESRSGNNVSNVLSLESGTGAIDPTSTFRYSGTAAAATPSTLESTRSIGNLEVTSGALTLATLTGSASNLSVSGGLLNLGTNSRSVATATFTGGTVSSGTLTTYSGGYTGGAGAGATATVSAILSGTGGLVNSGSGALVLSGANDFAGGATLSAGTVRVGVDGVGTVGAITSGALGTGTLTFAGGGISSDSNTTRTILNPVVFTGDGVLGDATNSGTLTFAAAADLGSATRTLTVASPAQFDGAIAGTGGLSKAGASTLTLTASNGYTGGTTLTAGTIGLGNTSALGTGTLTFAGASTLQSALATGTFTNAIAVSTGVTGTIDTNGNTNTFSGRIAGPGGIAKIGSGTLVLSASNTMGSGTLLVGGSSATDFGYVTLANGKALGNYTAVSLTQTGAGTSGINLTGGITTTYDLLTGGRNNAGTTGYALKSLSGSNAWNGNISINNTGGSYGFGADSGATLVLGGTVTTTVNTSARNFLVFGSGTTIVSGRLVGTSSTNSFNVLKNDAGTLIMSSSNAYQGNTTLNEGVIAFGSANAFGTGLITTASNGGVLRADVNSATVANAITLNVTGTLDTQANTTTLSGTIGGVGAFVKAGAGTLVLTGSNTYSGGTTINSGTLQIGSDGAAGWIQGNVANGGTLVFRRSDNVTFSGTISGTGGLVKSGAGRVTLTAANTFTGDVTIGSGQNSPNYALQLQNSEALGPASAVKRVSATGDNNSTSTLELAGDITIDANKTLLTTGHSFFQSGASTQGTPVFLENVSGSNTWLGSVIINGGGGSYSIESAAGTLVLGAEGTSSVVRNDVASSTRAFDFRGPGSIVVNSRFTTGTTSGAVTGFNMFGTGTLTIARTDNDFAFVPSLSVGTTRIASLSNSSVTSSLGTGTSFNVGGTLEHIGGVSSSSNRGIGLLGATPTIIASGTGTLALTATSAITYQDPTSVLAYTYSSGATTLIARDAAGILPGFTISGTGIAPGTTVTAVNYDTRVITLSQATTASSTSVTLTLGGQTAVPRTLVLGGTNTGTNVLAARLVDKAAGTAPLSFSKTGAGVWAITGSNGYTGATSVEGGTLRIGNGGSAGSIGTTSGIAVAAGGLLAFNRTDAYGGAFDRLISGSGDVRVESGFLNLTAANTYAGTTRVLTGGTLAVNGSLANAALFVDAGATLMGAGTILGDTTIQGSHLPGNSPGIETFTNLTYSGLAPSVTWELWSNTESNSPVAYDQIVVTGDLLFSDPTQLNLLFTGSGSGVNWTNSFWDSNRQWVLYDVAGTTTDHLKLSLVVQNWADSAGNLFGTVRGDATFTIMKDTESEDVLIVYAAVPEPGTLALAGLGLAAGAWSLVRRTGRRRASRLDRT